MVQLVKYNNKELVWYNLTKDNKAKVIASKRPIEIDKLEVIKVIPTKEFNRHNYFFYNHKIYSQSTGEVIVQKEILELFVNELRRTMSDESGITITAWKPNAGKDSQWGFCHNSTAIMSVESIESIDNAGKKYYRVKVKLTRGIAVESFQESFIINILWTLVQRCLTGKSYQGNQYWIKCPKEYLGNRQEMLSCLPDQWIETLKPYI